MLEVICLLFQVLAICFVVMDGKECRILKGSITKPLVICQRSPQKLIDSQAKLTGVATKLLSVKVVDSFALIVRSSTTAIRGGISYQNAGQIRRVMD